ncbi:TIGR01212 family radical SAM protein [Desulfovibrio sulfodismutans]|uniref:TIGR01212 family radical SAM protein n=1 Tax=Desulfolutivibrio sulfodismutans TaxID=63561 RepID=A0A7K3NPH6_9BACT|nr:TIGR01212 family radical SAM protein [Desulfolutivibrio sulfodismutans]NDY58017.1 TIGR01212 family radical SAM protein [Desulfolutivibrio sulfodismutans]QLA13593.1 TIGR01212 family radical SAM protein [Desulfolutivibrio sulfodismutans DSM 3696]
MRYQTLAASCLRRLGRRAHKIPLDAGFTCPNRDGTLSHGGCVFCNPSGSGTGLLLKGFGLRAQWDRLTARFSGRPDPPLLWAYLQSFSNTHGPAQKLAAALEAMAALPGIDGLCLGTRPDSLDDEKLDLLAAFPHAERRLEIGLQSANDATLDRIGRGHDAACFARAAHAAASRGLLVCAHVMAGLPGESPDDFLATVDFAATLPVDSIKLHNTLVVRHSRLEALWRSGGYRPMDRQDYVALAAAAIARLRSDMTVERINADAAPDELLAPAWAADKSGLIRDIRTCLADADSWQGRDRDAPDAMPQW